MKYYYIYYNAGGNIMYYTNDKTFEVCDDFEKVMLLHKSDLSDVYDSIGEFMPDNTHWRMVDGSMLCTNAVEQCRGCQKVSHEVDERYDAYGISTGQWCDTCYDSSKYPYRKDRYDYEGAGERLDDDY